jgi:hypothetical protein
MTMFLIDAMIAGITLGVVVAVSGVLSLVNRGRTHDWGRLNQSIVFHSGSFAYVFVLDLFFFVIVYFLFVCFCPLFGWKQKMFFFFFFFI